MFRRLLNTTMFLFTRIFTKIYTYANITYIFYIGKLKYNKNYLNFTKMFNDL